MIQTKLKIRIIDMNALWQRMNPGPVFGSLIIDFPPDDIAAIGNHRPLIVSSTNDQAMQLAHCLSQAFNDATVVDSEHLRCTYEAAAEEKRCKLIWESVYAENKDRYRVVIFIPEP